MDFEKTVPEWNAEGTEPPASLKTSGFQAGYKPPATFFNWFWHGVSECLSEIRAKLKGHAESTSNPHSVTAAQVGLDKVNNTADSEKHVQYAGEAGSANKVKYELIVRFNGGSVESTNKWTFDGSTSRSVNITPAAIGAAKDDLSNVTDAALLSKARAAGVSIPIVAAASTDGVAYTATVPGVTELHNGLTFIIVPDKESTTNAITLDVNGLGAKYVRVPLSFNTAALTFPAANNYYAAGRPVMVQYDANYATSGAWKTIDKQRTSAQDLYGKVPIDGVNGLQAALDAKATVSYYTATLLSTGWTGSAAPYSQDVTVTGITADDRPKVEIVQTGTEATDEPMRDAWGVVTRAVSGADKITVYASEKPQVDIPIQLEVVKNNG